MATTLFDLTYRVARSLGYLVEGLATGGTTSTLIDANDRNEDNDYWNSGTVWLIKDAGGAGAAPEREYAIISDFVSSTGVVSFRDAVTAAVGSGDRYAIATDLVPLHVIISKINESLLDMGVIPYVDTTTVTVAADQTEYTLPLGATLDLRQVWYQTDTDSNDNRWRELLNWQLQLNAVGSASTLILPYQYSTGYDIKLVYMTLHPELYDYDDVLSDAVPIERVVYPAIRDCLVWLKQRTRRNDWDFDVDRWSQRAEIVKQSRPILAPKRPSKVQIIRGAGSEQFLDVVGGLE